MRGRDNATDSGGSDLFFRGLTPTITAAHELKSPLSLIRQLALGLESYELSASERAEMLAQIVLVSERGLRLTTDVTKAARLDGSLFDLQPVNPLHICEEVAHELEPLFKAHNKSIQVLKRRRMPLVVAHPDLLRRVLLNFADNALHYSGEGEPVRFELSEQRTHQSVRLSVRDYGPAVSTDVWRVVRNAESKRGAALPARPQSSGLGLTIADQFARAMQGSIGATRHKDGASFYIDVQISKQLALL